MSSTLLNRHQFSSNNHPLSIRPHYNKFSVLKCTTNCVDILLSSQSVASSLKLSLDRWPKLDPILSLVCKLFISPALWEGFRESLSWLVHKNHLRDYYTRALQSHLEHRLYSTVKLLYSLVGVVSLDCAIIVTQRGDILPLNNFDLWFVKKKLREQLIIS